MSKAQALVTLPSLLKEFAKCQYKTGATIVSPKDEGTSSRSKAVQYFLRNYN